MRIVCFIFVFLILVCAPLHAEIGLGPNEIVKLRRIVDGDTVEVEGGEKIRLLGINTPELDEALGHEARERLRELLEGMTKKVYFQRCVAQERDKYGRILAFIKVGGKDVQASLLQEGLAVPLNIAPCGLLRIDDYHRLAANARRRGVGIWDRLVRDALSDQMTAQATGQYRGVRGSVRTVFDKGDRIYLNFGQDWRKDFTLVLSQKDVKRFQARGIDPVRDYRGKKMTVYGLLFQSRGTQMELFTPYQIDLSQ